MDALPSEQFDELLRSLDADDHGPIGAAGRARSVETPAGPMVLTTGTSAQYAEAHVAWWTRRLPVPAVHDYGTTGDVSWELRRQYPGSALTAPGLTVWYAEATAVAQMLRHELLPEDQPAIDGLGLLLTRAVQHRAALGDRALEAAQDLGMERAVVHGRLDAEHLIATGNGLNAIASAPTWSHPSHDVAHVLAQAVCAGLDPAFAVDSGAALDPEHDEQDLRKLMALHLMGTGDVQVRPLIDEVLDA